MPASLIGVSNTRRSPYSAWSPSVTRNTPPLTPTSSPNTTTRGSVAKRVEQARGSARRSASTSSRERLLAHPLEGRRRIRVHPIELPLGGRRRCCDHALAHLQRERLRLLLARRRRTPRRRGRPRAATCGIARSGRTPAPPPRPDRRGSVVRHQRWNARRSDTSSPRSTSARRRAAPARAPRAWPRTPPARRSRRRGRPGNRTPRHAARSHPRSAAAVGMLIAQPLFWQNSTSGRRQTPARLAASWKSPSLVAPSPK